MQKLIILCLIIGLILGFSVTSSSPVLAQSSDTIRTEIQLNFQQASPNDICQRYINQYAGVYASSENSDAAGLPFISETDRGIACGFVSTSQMRIQLARPVENITITYSGDMALEFRLNGNYVTDIEVSGATQGLYERALRYDELIFKSNGFSDLYLYQLYFGFDFVPLSTVSENFDDASSGTRCTDYLQEKGWIVSDNVELPGPLVASSATAGQTMPECEFSAQENLSIFFTEPMQYVQFSVSGAVDITLLLDSKPIAPTYIGFGPFLYQQVTQAAFNEIQLSTDDFGVRIDNLYFATHTPISRPLLMTEPDVNSECADVLSQFEGITATGSTSSSFEGPHILWNETQGIGCEFEPGNELQINFATPIEYVEFWIYGGADVEFWQGETLIETVDVSGLPVYYGRSLRNGIDAIHFIEVSGFSSFHLSDIRYDAE